ncbi:MAG: flagellar export protein FliJ [Spirochaetaceae bacterium]|jgi:flagellar export protein FliJ|nr:flagellar export protein FliJ [Spirochaetaceae bacterium]
MKKFAFNLEKILKLRSHAENDAKIGLGKALAGLSLLENRLSAVAVEQKNAAENRFSGGSSLPYMYTHENYLQRLEAEKEQLLKAAAAAELEVENARGLWTEAKADLKVMENLKDRKLASYRKESRKEE